MTEDDRDAVTARIAQLERVYQAAVEWAESDEVCLDPPLRAEGWLLEAIEAVAPRCWLCRADVNRGTRICRECATKSVANTSPEQAG